MRQQFDTRTWVRWVATFVGFPLAGLAAKGVAGPIDTITTAVVGGLAAGAVLGTVQAIALRTDRRHRIGWVLATAVGMATGLAVGARAVDFDIDVASLTAMGALTGAGVGLAQMMALPGSIARRLAWAAGSSAIWALGWLITSQVIVDADEHFANFGASGAIVATVLGGALLATRPAPALPNSVRLVPNGAR